MIRRNFIKSAVASSALLLTGLKTKLFAGQKDHAPLLSASENETLKTIHALRTIHGNFNEKEIPQAQLDTIIQASIQAASASGMQSYSIVAIKDRELQRKVCGYAGSAVLLYCIDYNRIKDTANSLNYEYHPDGIQAFITGSTNTIMALQTAVIAAKALGIDALTTNGVHRGDMQRVYDLLDLPKDHIFPLIALVLGYPTEEPEHHKGRLDGAGIIHQEKYHRATKKELEEIVKKYDNTELHLGLNESWKTDHDHYYDWLFTKWMGGATKRQTEVSQAFTQLKRRGFIDLQKG